MTDTSTPASDPGNVPDEPTGDDQTARDMDPLAKGEPNVDGTPSPEGVDGGRPDGTPESLVSESLEEPGVEELAGNPMSSADSTGPDPLEVGDDIASGIGLNADGFENERGDTDQLLDSDRASTDQLDDEDFASQTVTNDAVAGETVLGDTDGTVLPDEAEPVSDEHAPANDGYLAPSSDQGENVQSSGEADTIDGALSPGSTATGQTTSGE